jgi:hypothetical protein
MKRKKSFWRLLKRIINEIKYKAENMYVLREETEAG